MADDTLTFELGGRVELEQLHEGVTRFRRLVTALSPGKDVKWFVEDLQPGSAVITLRGESETPGQVEQIVTDYGNIGKSLETGEPTQYNAQVERAVQEVRELTRTVDFIRFETAVVDCKFFGTDVNAAEQKDRAVIGSLTGRVQTLSNRGSLRFSLYDAIHDKAVSCYLQPGQEEQMREAWGHRVRVSGQVTRDAKSGVPKVIRKILDIEILEDVEPGFLSPRKGHHPQKIWRGSTGGRYQAVARWLTAGGTSIGILAYSYPT